MGLFDKIKTKKPDAGEGKTTEIFEDAFSAIQADMVQICLEYVDNRADKIFIYASFEENTISCDYFYDIKGRKIERHKLNLVDDRYETYDVNSNSLNANYQYEPVYSQHHNKTSDDIFEEWFKEISVT